MFNPNILIGDVVTEAEIHEIFGCQTTFGIRLNKANNAIVIVSDATSGNTYADFWEGDTLYYTGTDAKAVDGNQVLTGQGNNNGALKDVWNNPNSTTLFLFEKYAKNQCTYRGVVTLAKEPYQVPRKSNPTQLVWKFPLKLANVEWSQLISDYEQVERKAAVKTEKELKKAINAKMKNPNSKNGQIKREATVSFWDRDSNIRAYVKIRAHGVCDLCQKPAPFTDESGAPYLEAHHIKWLSKGGEDNPRNMVALCPNCHRKMHVLDLEKDRMQLTEKAKKYAL
jgi:5-methylcytosine-specific restriction protein A